MPALTRRPGSARWTLAAGGNTRLRIVQELWTETADPHFEEYTFRIVPWRGDGAALLNHLTENDQHADLCFWDKAYAFQDLQAQIARGTRRGTLSLREFEAALLEEGFRVNRTTLSNYRFLIRRLGPLSACATRISGRAVQSRAPAASERPEPAACQSRPGRRGRLCARPIARHAELPVRAD